MKVYGKIVAAAVVFVIIGMPMLSYVYLRQGLSFRIDALEALKESDKDIQLTKALKSELEIEPKMVNAVVDLSKVDQTQMAELYDKYEGNKYFFLNTYISDSTNQMESWGDRHKHLDFSQPLQELFDKDNMILIDTSGRVRESYVYSEEGFKTFVQHLSVLLPVESSKKIKLER